MATKNLKKSTILSILLIFQIVFIFTMSSFGPDSSNAQSNTFVRLLSDILPQFNPKNAAPDFDINTLIFLVRKTAHFTEYACLGALFFLNLRLRFRSTKLTSKNQDPTNQDQSLQISSSQNPSHQSLIRQISSHQSPTRQNPTQKESKYLESKYLSLAILASALYACTDEFHQLFVPGRTGQIFDVFVDTLGATFGCLLVLGILKIKQARIKTD